MVTVERIRLKSLSDCTHWYTYSEPTPKGEKVVVELTHCTNPGGKNSLPYLWHKHGHTSKVLETYWCAQTYVTNAGGSCYGAYNPTTKPKDTVTHTTINGRDVEYRGHEIDFGWMLEGTEASRKKLLAEIERRAFGAPATSERAEAEDDDA